MAVTKILNKTSRHSLRAGSLDMQGRWIRNREPAKPARRMGLRRPCLSSEAARRLQQTRVAVRLLRIKPGTLTSDRQLNDSKFYRRLNEDITVDIQKRVTVYVNRMYTDDLIDEKTKQYLIQPDVIPGRFYILPKVHKTR